MPLFSDNSQLVRDNFRIDLTHWDQMTIETKLVIICSNNDLSSGRHQVIILTNAGILLIGPLGTNFSEIHFKMSSGKRPQCDKASVFIEYGWDIGVNDYT